MTVQNVDGKCIDIGGATGMTGSSSAGAGGSSDVLGQQQLSLYQMLVVRAAGGG
jgi:hypothetical protein